MLLFHMLNPGFMLSLVLPFGFGIAPSLIGNVAKYSSFFSFNLFAAKMSCAWNILSALYNHERWAAVLFAGSLPVFSLSPVSSEPASLNFGFRVRCIHFTKCDLNVYFFLHVFFFYTCEKNVFSRVK